MYLALLSVWACGNVDATFPLMVFDIALQHRCSDPDITFQRSICPKVVCWGEHTCSLLQLTYILKELRSTLFFIVWKWVFLRPILVIPVFYSAWETSIERMCHNGITWTNLVRRSAIKILYWKPGRLFRSSPCTSIAIGSKISNTGN